MVYKKKSAKIEAVESITKDEVQKFAKASNKESVADQLAKLQVTLNNALGDVAAKFQETLSNHEKLVQANVLETQELERLRGIKVNADTLAELERARQDVKETATAALNAAGNREALNTLQNALQNQNNQGKVK